MKPAAQAASLRNRTCERVRSLGRSPMKCLKCQHLNDVAAKVCAECASPLAGTCAHCGYQLPPMAKFCPECAQPTGLSASPLSPFGSPDAYTPRHLAKRILD